MTVLIAVVFTATLALATWLTVKIEGYTRRVTATA
jgi:hypothetical protein